MDPHPLDPLPFSQPFHPTFADADDVRLTLEHRVPPELAAQIVSLGYAPWVAKRKANEQEYPVGHSRPGPRYSVAGLYLSTGPIPDNGRNVLLHRIIFQTRAADQGWATFGGDGTFHNSHTWFEASILRPLPISTEENHHDVALEDSLPPTWLDPESAREDLRQRGWDFVEADDGRVAWRVNNNITASREYRNYKVEWVSGVQTEVEDDRAAGKGEGFLELLKPGFIVVLWARADQAAWCNKVAAATIEIEYELL